MSNKIERLGVMLDVSRNAVMKPEVVKKYIDLISKLGYNCLMLYIEDIYEIKSQPYFGRGRGRYSQEELKSIDDYAFSKGIEVIPCIQTLSHINQIFRWPTFSKINDSNMLFVGEEETYKFIEEMFDTISSCFRSRIINVGMDEAVGLGRGRYLDRFGYRPPEEIMVEHLNKVSDLAKKRGLNLLMWGDMFIGVELYIRTLQERPFQQSEIDDAVSKSTGKIPENVDIIYWNYYSKKTETYDALLKAHNDLKTGAWFAGGLWTWAGFAPRNDFGVYTTKKAFEACFKNNIKNVVMAMWGDGGNECSRFAIIPSLFYTAQLAKGITDDAEIKANFEKEFGISYEDFALLDLPGTDRYSEVDECCTSDKYFFYNDCFLGLYDALVPVGENERYAALVPKLEKMAQNKDYGYLFKTMCEFCRAMSVKSELGVKTRKAYLAKDKDMLKALLPDYTVLPEFIDGFYEALKTQWHYENKPQGFEIQDARLGGIKQRVAHCKETIEKYIAGDIDSIPELDEPVLDPRCRTGEDAGKSIFEINWAKIITPNTI